MNWFYDSCIIFNNNKILFQVSFYKGEMYEWLYKGEVCTTIVN